MIRKYDIFIGYSQKDWELALEIVSKLTRAGFNCFLARKCLSAGKKWQDGLREAIKCSEQVLLIMTPNSRDSKWVIFEAGAAWGLEKPIIPALLFVKPDELMDCIREHQTYDIKCESGKMELIEALEKSKYLMGEKEDWPEAS
ncbi:MAG: toll/interleukin-1 receptor domain-containing protein [Nitrospira sp.]|nr:toll/interleukin-1 receptor domain-containing protein [Nitrospira sp.]